MDQATQVERLCTVRPRLLLELTTALRQAGQRPGTISSQPAVYEQTVLRSLRAASRRQALVLTQVSKHLRDGPLVQLRVSCWHMMVARLHDEEPLPCRPSRRW